MGTPLFKLGEETGRQIRVPTAEVAPLAGIAVKIEEPDPLVRDPLDERPARNTATSTQRSNLRISGSWNLVAAGG